MVAGSYALICPLCSRKLRARPGLSGQRLRCSLCQGSFLSPPTLFTSRSKRPATVNSHCQCGEPIPIQQRREDIWVHCSRCHKWVIAAKNMHTQALPALGATPPPRHDPPTPHPIPMPSTAHEEEIARARHVVDQLLPSEAPKLPGLDIAAFNQFRHEVGGDYYDFVHLPDGRLGIAIADVSGKGVGAAMLMVRLREILHSVAPHAKTVEETVATVNARLVTNIPRGMFVTFLYAAIDPASRELRAVNAGHCAPFVWRARLTGVRLLDVRGPALGLLQPEVFAGAISPRLLPLESGDCMCLFTDGVTEAKNAQGEDFGESRLASALRQYAHRSARGIADAIVSAVAAHTGSAVQHDDITLIILKAD